MRTPILILALLVFALPASAANSCANVAAGANGQAVTSLASGSWTPTANAFLRITVVNHDSVSATAPTPTLSGNGLTWVQVLTSLLGTGSKKRLTTFRSMGASPTTGATTADFAGVSQDNVLILVSECTGTDTSGTNGSGAVVQAVDGDNPNSSTTCTATLAAFGSANNSTLGSFAIVDASTITVGAGFTQLNTNTVGSAIRNFQEWQLANDTTVDATTAAAKAWACHGIELKAASSARRSKVKVIN